MDRGRNTGGIARLISGSHFGYNGMWSLVRQPGGEIITYHQDYSLLNERECVWGWHDGGCSSPHWPLSHCVNTVVWIQIQICLFKPRCQLQLSFRRLREVCFGIREIFYSLLLWHPLTKGIQYCQSLPAPDMNQGQVLILMRYYFDAQCVSSFCCHKKKVLIIDMQRLFLQSCQGLHKKWKIGISSIWYALSKVYKVAHQS